MQWFVETIRNQFVFHCDFTWRLGFGHDSIVDGASSKYFSTGIHILWENAIFKLSGTKTTQWLNRAYVCLAKQKGRKKNIHCGNAWQKNVFPHGRTKRCNNGCNLWISTTECNHAMCGVLCTIYCWINQNAY